LNPRQLRRGYVGLKLQHLQLDLEQIALAYVASVVTGFSDIYRVLKALEILHREFKGRFCKLHVDKAGGHAEGQTALIVSDQRTRLGGQVSSGLQAVLPLFAPFKQVADAQVELGHVVEVVRAELAWLEDRQELPIAQNYRIGAQIRGRFLRWMVVRAARMLWLCWSAI